MDCIVFNQIKQLIEGVNFNQSNDLSFGLQKNKLILILNKNGPCKNEVSGDMMKKFTKKN